MNDSDKSNTIDKLFQFFHSGDWDQAATLFSAEAQITRQYGDRITTNTVSEFINSLKSGPLSQVGIPEYMNRKVSLTGDDGFVERHTARLSIKENQVEIPVCIIGQFDTAGKISELEEYLDPSPIIKILTQPTIT